MKRLMIASTALALSAGAAMADVTISGYGRFGLNYYDVHDNPFNSTTFVGRMRLNFDGSRETDNGVKFGGRIRMQWDQGNGSRGNQAALNAAYLYTSYGGLRVEVGNSNTAYDSAALLYAPEIGFQSRSFGDPSGVYYSYETSPYSRSAYGCFAVDANGECVPGTEDNGINRVGIFVSYSVGDFTGRASYVTPNQNRDLNDIYTPVLPDGLSEEWGISADYTFGAFVVSGAYVQNGGGIDGNDNWFIGGAYNGDNFTVGLNYIDNGDFRLGGPGADGNFNTAADNTTVDVNPGETWTLYGSYKFDAVTVGAYVANNNADYNDNDTSFGIGASYDLGGATLAGAIESGYLKDEVRGDLGVKFDF